MKKIRIGMIGVLIVAMLVMSLNLIVSAVGEGKKEEKDELLLAQNEIALYKEQVETLEKELYELKQEQYVNKQEYEEKIAELELKLLATEIPSTPNVQKPESKARYTYTVSNDKVTITGYSGTDTVLEIPSAIDGLPVAGIGREAFKGANFTEVIIPSSLEKIDWFAFCECKSLRKITIPSSVGKIEYGAFDGVENFIIVCVKNSYAHRYAKSYGFGIEHN